MPGVKNSPFVETFGETPLVKVIDFFLTYPSFDYTKSFVAKETGISRITIEGIWNKLIKEKVISKTREIGNAEYFKLNRENQKVKVLMRTSVGLSIGILKKEEVLVRA